MATNQISASTVFSIGKHGRGPLQFSGDWQAGEASTRHYRIGRDTPRETWPAFHPGPLDAHHGWRAHRLVVEFAADGPSPAYVLRCSFFASHGPCPDIEVTVGGRVGIVRPEVVREDRSEVFRQSPTAGFVDLEIEIPGEWVGTGPQQLSVATVLDVPERDDDRYPGRPGDDLEGGHPVYGSWFGSGITWDCLSLEQRSHPPRARPSEVVATPRYVERDGALHEIVALTVGLEPGGRMPRDVSLEVEGARLSVPVDAAPRDFGTVALHVEVPELTGPTTVVLDVDGSRSDHVVTPARKWTLHVVPHVHLDIGFTDYQGKVLELHSRNLDRVTAALRVDPSFRYSLDGALVLSQFLATRGPRSVEPVMQALRDGAISTNAFHSLFLSGIASLEECFRAAYLAADLRDEHGVRISYANLTDVPSYSAALPSILRELGIDAFVGIQNHGRGAASDSDRAHLMSPVMWEGVDGSRVLAFFSDSYSQLRFMASDPQTLHGGELALDQYVRRYDRPDYVPHDLPVIGTHADNEDLGDGDMGFVGRWNALYAYPRLVVSTLADYLDAVRPLADRLPVWRGDGGSYWEDGVGTAAGIEAIYRRAQTLVPTAEGLGALNSLVSDTYRPHRGELDKAWEGLLVGGEHTWTWSHMSAHPHGAEGHDQLHWKRHHVETAFRVGTDETRRALSQLGEMVTTPGPTLLVHNPLSWRRSADIEVETAADTEFFDGDQPLESEVTRDMGGLHRVRLHLPDLPEFGYRALRVGTRETVQPGGPTPDSPTGAAPPATSPATTTVRSPRWEVRLDPGSGMVVSLVHVPSGRELLDPTARWPLGTVVYAAEGDEATTRGERIDRVPHLAGRGDPDDSDGSDGDLAPGMTTVSDRRPRARRYRPTVTAAATTLVSARRTFDGWRITARGHGVSMPEVEVELLLRDHSDEVDMCVRLEKEAVLAKEAVYVAFPFATTDPVVRYDRQQGWIDPSVDHSPGSCTEWFTTQYGVVVTSGADGPGVAWSAAEAPLFTVGDIVTGRWPDAFDPGSGALLSWVMNNYWPTNTPPSQAGPVELHYRFAPVERFDAAHASRLGRELRVLPAVSDVTWLDKADTEPRTLPAREARLLDLDAPDTVQVTVAQSRRVDGVVLRVLELTGRAARVRLRHPLASRGRAQRCHADERPLERLAVDEQGYLSLDLAGYGVATVVIER